MKKRLLTLFFSMCMIITVLPIIALAADETPTTGTCGDGVTWTYTPNLDEYGDDLGGTLVISGDGAMENYRSSYDAPWRTDITELQIENGVTSIGDYAFYRCEDLTGVTIPDSVISIGESAFYMCDSLTSVTIPDSVTSIGDYAFYRCKDLASATIPDGVTSIGEYAFSYCNGLTSVTIPGSVINIGENTFSFCKKLSEEFISNGVRTIGNCAFSDCTSLSDIFIPESVYRIADFTSGTLDGRVVFSGCDNLTAIDVDPKNSIYSSQNGILFNKEKTKLIFCPRGVTNVNIPYGVQIIDEYSFSNSSRITNVIIPETVTNINSYAFRGCTALESVVIPDSVTSIGREAFKGCTALRNVKLSNSVTGYSQYSSAFGGCTSLTSVTVPEGITNLSGTFSGCTKLTFVSLPVSLKKIAQNTFKDCARLQTITYAGTETQWGLVEIAQQGNEEMGVATRICIGTSPSNPEDPGNQEPSNPPETPDAVTPDDLDLTISNGGFGKRVSLQIEGGHWLTIQVRHVGSIAITSVQVPGSGLVTMSLSAPVGSMLQVWETEAEMTFTNGVPNNPILSTAVRQL